MEAFTICAHKKSIYKRVIQQGKPRHQHTKVQYPLNLLTPQD